MAEIENLRSEDRCCTHNGICMRILVVWLLCFLGLSFIIVLDSPGSLQHKIMDEFNVTTYQFSLLYSLSSWPNAFCWLSGFIIDRYLGISMGSIIFLLISCFGSILYVLAVYLRIYWLMAVARFFFGFGGEATSLACNAYILMWFPDKGLNTVFGLTKAIPWLGSAIIFQFSNRLLEFLLDNNYSDWKAFFITIAITMSIIFLCLVCVIMLAIVSRPLIKRKKEVAEDMLKIKVTDIVKFPLSFWILIFASSVVLNSCFNFILLSQNFFRETYHLGVNSSNNIISIFSVAACLVGPLFGFIVDKVGRNLIFITLSTLGALSAHLLYLLTSVHPVIPTIILSCSLSLMLGSAVSAYTFLVKPCEVNTAYGVVQTVTSGFYASGILIAGDIISKYTYRGGEIFYCISLCVSLFLCLILWVVDWREGRTLTLSNKQREYNNNNDRQSLIRTISQKPRSSKSYGGTLTLPMSRVETTKPRKTVYTISRNYEEYH